MRFNVAFNWMKHGKKMTCPGFIGYWCWDPKASTILIVTKNNEVIDIRETPDVDFTMGFINTDSWSFYHGADDPRENTLPDDMKATEEKADKTQGLTFGDAVEAMKNGHRVKVEGVPGTLTWSQEYGEPQIHQDGFTMRLLACGGAEDGKFLTQMLASNKWQLVDDQ